MAVPALAYPGQEPDEVWSGGPFTERDLDQFPDDGYRYEIIDGSLYVTPPPSTGHNARGADLLFVLRQAAPPGWRVVYEVGIHAPNRNFVADIVVLRPGAPTDGSWREASQVALAVEIESPSTRLYDRLLKSRLYAEAGIPSYWRLDPKGPVLYAYELTDKGEYTEVAQVRPGSPWRAEQPFAIVVDPAAWGP